jgi:DNA (cytosine-5)-methyltransferase 1
MLTLGSLFAGVGGFDLGFEAAGYRTQWQVEIDPWCQKVLARHWPEATQHGDVCSVSGTMLAPVAVVTFGSPCQDMSVAGARAGLIGARSGLFHQAVRIIDEMRKATDGRLPAWAVWENVPGALSSDDGNDFAAVLDELARIGAVEIEWRVLDARYFGVPQRRRRIFLLAGFHPRGDSAAPILLEPESSQRRAPTSGTPGEDLAGSLGASTARSSSPGGGGLRNDLDSMTFIPLAARCDTARGERLDGETDTLLPVSFAWQAGGKNDASGAYEVNQTPTLPCSQTLAIAYQCHGSNVVPMGVLRAGNGNEGGGVPFIPVAVSENQRAECLLTEYAHDLTTGGGKPGQGYPAVLTEAYPLTMRGRHGEPVLEMGEPGVYAALRAGDGEGRQNKVLTPDLAVRRLTPRECERLMGWPDDHTRYTADGKEISDSHRYRMCGNGVVAPVAEWIARRLRAAHAECACGCHKTVQPGLVPCPRCEDTQPL